MAPIASETFVCKTCGKAHAGTPTDTAFTLPDEVWSIPEGQRSQHAKWTSDLCQMGERYFIRCLLRVPFAERPGYYGWGVWAEVQWDTFKHYLDVYELDASSEPPVSGHLANKIPTYETTLGLPLQLHFGTSAARPTISFHGGATHLLAQECQTGLSAARYHEILAARGVLDET